MLERIGILTFAAVFTIAVVAPSVGRAQTTWHVDDDAPGDPGPGDPNSSDPDEDGSAQHPFDAIQEAIGAAQDGDTVLVADGTYAGVGNRDLDPAGKVVTVRSQNGPEGCIIDCEGEGRGFLFQSGETIETVVDGFTISNGDAREGGGVYCVSNSSPTIANCTITGHVAYVGAGVYCHDHCNPMIIGCQISENAASGGGGGICVRNFSNPSITACTIARNTADVHGGGIYCGDRSYPTISNCEISSNAAQFGGGAVFCSNGRPTIANCVIVENASHSYWYGNIQAAFNSTVTIANCTIARNTGWDGPSMAIHCEKSRVVLTNCILWDNYDVQFGMFQKATLTVSYSDIQGGQATVWCLDPNTFTLNWGAGNIDVDPTFEHLGAHLLADSPCIDAGDPNGDYTGQTDIDGETRVANGRADIGPDEFLDRDTDGLPDWWEQLHFGSPAGADPNGDEDDDQLINLGEYARSRNPWRPAGTYYVDVVGDDEWDGLAPEWDGQHGPKATIQAAINLADHYEQDIVLVADGTYTGHSTWGLNFRGRAMTLRSMNGPESCIIDCQGARRGFRFVNGETAHSIVSGFAIVNGYAGHGGAVFCKNLSRPTILDCVITGNQSRMFGGAVCSMWGCNPTLVNCTITGNAAPHPWFGIGGGVSCYEARATIINCAIVGNEAGFRGGGVDLYGRATPTIINSILWDNSADQGPQTGFYGYAVFESPIGQCIPRMTMSYSDVQDADPNRLADWGDGNIAADPLFLDAGGSDYRLGPGSPCIDACDNTAVPPDVADRDDDGDTSERTPLDLAGNTRFVDDIFTDDTGVPDPPSYSAVVDLGAFEYQFCFGDLDGDGAIGLSDLATLLANYGATSQVAYTDGDLDGDGDVDSDDLYELLVLYGVSCFYPS